MQRLERFAAVWVAVGLITLARVLVLAFNKTELYVDESQYWLWGQHLDFGYFSKPPLIGWVLRLFHEVLGSDTQFLVRLPAPLFHGATALILAAWARQEWHDQPAAPFWVAVAYLTLPIISFGSFLISTDTILAPFFAAGLWTYSRLSQDGGWRWAVATGALIGLAFMAKYAAFYFFIGAVFAYVLTKQRPSVRMLLLLLGTFFVVISPNILWNIAHDLTTVGHTMDNVGWVQPEASVALNWSGGLIFVLSQIGSMGPILFIIWAWAVLRPGDVRLRPLIWFSLPIFALVTLQAILDEANANWAYPAFLAATLLAVLWALEHHRVRMLAIGVTLNALLCLFVPLVTVFPMAITTGDGNPLASRYIGQAAMTEKLQRLATSEGAVGIVATRRDILADLFYRQTIETVPPFADPRPSTAVQYYKQTFPLPADLAGNVLQVTQANAPICPDAQKITEIAEKTGAYANTRFFVYKTPVACFHK